MSNATLPFVRRLEAVGMRAWPSQQSSYDGAWLNRISPTQDGRRINSVTPLDPGDRKDVARRLDEAGELFSMAGRPLVVRETPLIPTELLTLLTERKWQSEGTSFVQTMPLKDVDLSAAKEQLSYRDISRWVEHFTAIRKRDESQAAPLAQAIEGIPAEVGLFMTGGDDEQPLATAMAVHDGDMVGLFEVAVAAHAQRRGHAMSLVKSALLWAQKRGARTAWLQVEADNEPALALYGKLGFTTAYTYRYWRAAAEQGS
ncbi:MAG: GNAT family N-acetyltransferase [Pseudomonadota bacterium]